MPTLKNSDFKDIFIGPTRTCPECEEETLEITDTLNIFECNFCGAKWQRIQPLMREDGTMTHLPQKLKRLLRKKSNFSITPFSITSMDKAIFAAGCFWHVEHTFNTTPGVIEAISGYTRGKFKNPSYEDVCTGS